MSHPDTTQSRPAGRHAAPSARPQLPLLAKGDTARGGRHAVRRAVAPLRSTRLSRLAPAGALLVAASATVAVAVPREGSADQAAEHPTAAGSTSSTPSPTATLLPLARALQLENAVATLATPPATPTASATATAVEPEQQEGVAARAKPGKHRKATEAVGSSGSEKAASSGEPKHLATEAAASAAPAPAASAPTSTSVPTSAPSTPAADSVVDAVLGLVLGTAAPSAGAQ